MKVEWVHVGWMTSYDKKQVLMVTAKIVTNDGSVTEIKNCLTNEVVEELERQILSSAREKFMIAAKESNLLTADVVVEADDCPF